MANYRDLEQHCTGLQQEIIDLRVENGSLVAEVNMLREALERSENDRVRLQAVSSTLTGQLLSINAAIAEVMRTAIKHGIEAVEQREDNLDQAGAEARDVLRRVEPAGASETAPESTPSPRPPQAVGAPLEQVDWSRLPQ
jgi:chromosome segregation ATPase